MGNSTGQMPWILPRQTIRNRKGYRENLVKETLKHDFFFKGKTIVFRDIDLNDKSIKKYKEVIARVITWEGGTEGVKSGGAHGKDSG